MTKTSTQHSYDSACEVLAEHFLGTNAERDAVEELAQCVQDAVESWLADVACTPQVRADRPEELGFYNPAYTHGEIGTDEAAARAARLEAQGYRMRPDGTYFKAGS